MLPAQSPNSLPTLVKIFSLVYAWMKVLPISPQTTFRSCASAIISKSLTETPLTTVARVDKPRGSIREPSQTSRAFWRRSDLISYTKCNLQYWKSLGGLKSGDLKSKQPCMINAATSFSTANCQFLLPAASSMRNISFQFFGSSKPYLKDRLPLGSRAFSWTRSAACCSLLARRERRFLGEGW